MEKNKTTKKSESNVEKSVEKINVNFEDEVTFIIDRVENSKDKNILISIPSGSDLLISTVSLELLAEAADKKGKKIVVVTDDEVGKNLARSVGITVRDSVNNVDDMAWKEADIAFENRQEEVKVRREKAGETDESGIIPIDATQTMDEDYQIEKPIIPEVKEESILVEEKSDDMVDQLGVKKVKVGDLEMVVDSSPVSELKGEEEMSQQIKPEVLRPISKNVGKGGFVGRDFSNFELKGLDQKEKEEMAKDIKPISLQKQGSDNISVPLGSTKRKLDFSFIKNIFVGANKKKIFIIIFVILFFVLGGSAFAALQILPEVVVTLSVDSVEVEYSGEITADVNESELDEEGLVIPAKIEEVEKNGSDTANTTGIESKGEKATGSVWIVNKNVYEEVVLNAGTVLTSGDLKFVTSNSVVVEAKEVPLVNKQVEVDVEAQDIGEEYNVTVGTTFAVSGYAAADVSAQNDKAFSGGTEEEYKVVAQADIDNLVKDIKKSLDSEALEELNGKTDNSRWVLVNKSVDHDLKGAAKASAPAGAEAETVDVSIETVSKGLYYDGNKMDELIEYLLIKDFDGQIKEIELSENVDKSIEVKEFDIDEGKIVFTVEVSGFVIPQLDDNTIVSELAGKSWTDGIKYLEDMDYVSEEYDVDYYPEWIPEALWKMPGNKDKITVRVKNVTPEPEEDSSEEETSSEESE